VPDQSGRSATTPFARSASDTGLVLKGETVLPTKFELVINLKTAKALDLTIPETLLATANEVIQ
jgi:putative ABC transport system substrate-binding protein